MSVTGLCSMCEQREATHVCVRCGGAVCDAHYEASDGVCAECAASMGGESGGGDGTGNTDGPGLI